MITVITLPDEMQTPFVTMTCPCGFVLSGRSQDSVQTSLHVHQTGNMLPVRVGDTSHLGCGQVGIQACFAGTYTAWKAAA